VSVLFLAWEWPWPARAGQALRTQGLLVELARGFDVDLVVLARHPPTPEQSDWCRRIARSVTMCRRLDRSPGDRLKSALLALGRRIPYHSAMARRSLRRSGVAPRLGDRNRIVYASLSHWEAAAPPSGPLPHWVLDQHNADVEFWRVYARERRSLAASLAAYVNARVAAGYFRRAYSRVGRVVAVCEEDRRLTLDVAPRARVEVIRNGVDCEYFTPRERTGDDRPTILFTGTSVPRNLQALRWFMMEVLPGVRRPVPGAALVVAGGFSAEAQQELSRLGPVEFSGPVEDIRPWYGASAVFVSPFMDSYGSKLKVAQALAMGVCVVGTPAGVRGFPVADGESALVGRDGPQLAARIVTALRDAAVRRRLGEAGRRLALEQLDWRVLGRRLRQLVAETHQECAAASSATRREAGHGGLSP